MGKLEKFSNGTSSIEVRPVAGRIGAEISGVQLNSDIP